MILVKVIGHETNFSADGSADVIMDDMCRAVLSCCDALEKHYPGKNGAGFGDYCLQEIVKRLEHIRNGKTKTIRFNPQAAMDEIRRRFENESN